MGLSCCPPDSRCKRFNRRQRMVEVRTFPQWSLVSRLIERDPPILAVSKVLCLRHKIGEILFCKIVPFETNVFISIMFEHGFTKIRISHETIVNPCEFSLDAPLVQNMGQMIFFLFWSFPTSVAMRSSLLNYVLWKIDRRSNVYSMKPRLATLPFKRCPQMQ